MKFFITSQLLTFLNCLIDLVFWYYNIYWAWKHNLFLWDEANTFLLFMDFYMDCKEKVQDVTFLYCLSSMFECGVNSSNPICWVITNIYFWSFKMLDFRQLKIFIVGWLNLFQLEILSLYYSFLWYPHVWVFLVPLLSRPQKLYVPIYCYQIMLLYLGEY